MVTCRFVETQYKLEIGAAQNTQLSKAIATGAEKGTFVLPKGKLIISSHHCLLAYDLICRCQWQGQARSQGQG